MRLFSGTQDGPCSAMAGSPLSWDNSSCPSHISITLNMRLNLESQGIDHGKSNWRLGCAEGTMGSSAYPEPVKIHVFRPGLKTTI